MARGPFLDLKLLRRRSENRGTLGIKKGWATWSHFIEAKNFSSSNWCEESLINRTQVYNTTVLYGLTPLHAWSTKTHTHCLVVGQEHVWGSNRGLRDKHVQMLHQTTPSPLLYNYQPPQDLNFSFSRKFRLLSHAAFF